AGLGGGLPGVLEAAGVGLGLVRFLLGGVLAQQVAEEGGDLVEAAGRVLGGAVRVEEFGVGRAGPVQRLRARGELGGGGAQQGLRLFGVAGPHVVGELGVFVALLGGEAFGLAAQAAELFARAR